ncbi:hypothetical protein ILYODFUR_007296, partial [Ilyodon furcidens]
MATQVEALLPGNPLAKAEEHDKIICGEPVGEEEEEEEEEQQHQQRAKRQRGVADSTAGLGGTTGVEEQTQAAELQQDEDGCDSGDKPSEEGVKGSGSGGKKEFTEAPPPKVNPWTRKMNAVTVVSVNGEAHTEPSGPAKVVRAGIPPKARRGGKVGDFGDTNSWPTPGEIATKDMQ